MFKILTLLLFISASLVSSFGQDKQELEQEKRTSRELHGEHPLEVLMKSKRVSLKPELNQRHPRVFLTESEINDLKEKTKTQPQLWQTALERVRALTVAPPAPPAQARRVQNEVGLGIAEAAFVYKITNDEKYLAAAKKYMDAALAYEIWGYSYNKPNVDLAAGHLLYGMGWAYDLLYHDLTPAERAKYREKLIKQARLLYQFFKPKPGKTYAYSQNHTFIPISGLAVTAYALMDETPEAKDWAELSRAVFDRVLATYSEDGYYYEGVEYWIFSTPWLVHYIDAHLHATGENLYLKTPGFRLSHKYLAHSTLPGGEFNFDFGDIYAGNITRSRRGEDYERERIDGKFRTNYNILYNLAARYKDSEAQGVADWLKSKGQVNAEEFWTFIWFNPEIKPVAIENQEKWHYFPDHEVVYWRSSWNDDATALAFKAGPPEGHAANEKIKRFPDWRLSSGHAHPDAGSFIIWSNGKYLTGDSGYAGVPLTEHHNAIVFGGRGQAKEGAGHDAFADFSYEMLNQIRLQNVRLNNRGVSLVADLSKAYDVRFGVKSLRRRFIFKAPDVFEIEDSIQTNEPQIVTSYLHSDNQIKQISQSLFEFEPGSTSLLAEILAPKKFEAKIEKNVLTAPGQPGSVDKGEREERGVRLTVSNLVAANKIRFLVRLKINQK